MTIKTELYARSLDGIEFVKSTRSANDDPPDNCVLVGFFPDGAAVVRDSKAPSAGNLRFTAAEWNAFIGSVRDGEF